MMLSGFTLIFFLTNGNTFYLNCVTINDKMII